MNSSRQSLVLYLFLRFGNWLRICGLDLWTARDRSTDPPLRWHRVCCRTFLSFLRHVEGKYSWNKDVGDIILLLWSLVVRSKRRDKKRVVCITLRDFIILISARVFIYKYYFSKWYKGSRKSFRLFSFNL